MTRFALLVAAAFAAVPSMAAPLAYPGNTWGNVERDLSGFEGWSTQGKVQQGVDWLEMPYAGTLDTYAGYSWRARNQNETYFNAQGPFLGIMSSRGPISAGFDYTLLDYPSLRLQTQTFDAFVSWYWRREFSARGHALPFSTWGRAQDELANVNSVEGIGCQGWIQQGVDWMRLPGGVVVDTFAAFRWRLRNLNRQYYDSFGPALGVELTRGPLQLDLEYDWRRYPYLVGENDGVVLTLQWYFDWDLKKLLSR